MKKKFFLKQAEGYRRQGYSFNEISRKFGIAKSTTSLWLRNIPLNESGKKRLKKISDNGRKKAVITNRRKREVILRKIKKYCTVLRGRKYVKDDFKLFLAMLYWGEGSKTGRKVSFMNSDPEMIRTYLFLLRNTFKIDENKLRLCIHLHSYHDENEVVDFWSRITGIKRDKIHIYRKENSGKNIKEGYRGCVSVNYCDVKIFKEILLIIKRFVNRFSKMRA
jgi:transposase